MRHILLLTLNLLYIVANAQKKSIELIKSEFLFSEGVFFAQCHASTMEETDGGSLLAAWFGGSHEGSKDVVIWGIKHNGSSWSDPTIWADGKINDTLQYPCWNPVLFRSKNEKKIYLYYKVGPNPREWWGMVKTSVDGGITWNKAERLPEGVLGPIKNKPVELKDGTVLSPSSVEINENRWIAHVERSTDKQKSWSIQPIDHSSALNVIQPSILIHPDGRLQVLCRSKEGVVATAWSDDNGKTWSPLGKTNLINPNAATDAIRINNKFLIVYNPDLPGRDWWEGRAKLRLAESADGINWKDILILEDEEKGEFSYPTIITDAKGKIHITYTYNRKNIKHLVLSALP